MRKYQYNCVSPYCEDELNFIIDNMEDITLGTLKKNVDKDDLKALISELGYNKDFKIENDWSVSYHKSEKEDGTKVYILCHSAIEHIFY